jgi:hypothetical protein
MNLDSALRTGAAIVNLLFLLGCKSDPAGPPVPRNPREYAWSVDTLAYPGSFQTLMRVIWGPARNNIYIGGHNSSGFGSMYRWDGQTWTNVKLLVTEGGPLSRVGSFTGIFGFSAQDIYAVGSSTVPQSFLIHFDGARWREVAVPSTMSLETVWGRTSDTAWIGGWGGFLSRYVNTQFIQDTLPYTFDTTGQHMVVRQIAGDSRTVYLVLDVSPRAVYDPVYYLYELAGSRWEVRDSNALRYPWIYITQGGTVYRNGYGEVQRRVGSGWVTSLSGLNSTRGGLAASSESNMFAVGWGDDPVLTSRLFHYDGSDWFEYTDLRMQEVALWAAWTDGTEAFVIGNTFGSPMKTVVLHGK